MSFSAWTKRNADGYRKWPRSRTEEAECNGFKHRRGNFWAVYKSMPPHEPRTMRVHAAYGFDMPLPHSAQPLPGYHFPRQKTDMRKYDNRDIWWTCSRLLTFDNSHRPPALMSRSLKSFCRRFGIPLEDPTAGKDIAALIAADNWSSGGGPLRE